MEYEAKGRGSGGTNCVAHIYGSKIHPDLVFSLKHKLQTQATVFLV